MPQTYADVSLAERELDYRCTTPVEVGVKQFCDWYLEERGAGRIP